MTIVILCVIIISEAIVIIFKNKEISNLKNECIKYIEMYKQLMKVVSDKRIQTINKLNRHK